MRVFKEIFELLKKTFTEWQEDKASRLAAALAYYTAFSLAPLIVIVLGVAGFIFSQDLVGDYMIEQVQAMVGESGAEVVRNIIENASRPSASLVAALIGVGTLIFGATGVFAQLQDSLNTVWDVAPRPDKGVMKIVETRFTSLTMVLGIGFLLLVSLVVSTALSAITDTLLGPLAEYKVTGQIINFIISFSVITLLFAMIFKVLPDVEIQWGDVWVGAAATALLFGIGKFLLGFYLGNKSFGSTYGAAGSILIILLWVYYSAQIFLFGAEFTQVYARRYGSKIVPDEDAIRLTPAMRARQGIPRPEQLEAAASHEAPDREEGVSAGSRPKQLVAPQSTSAPASPPDRFVTALVTLFMLGIFLRGLFTAPGKKTAK